MKYFQFNPFGNKSLSISFNCKECNNRVVSREIYIPYPNLAADTSSESQNSEEDSATCDNCEELYEIALFTTFNGGDGHVTNLDEDDDLDILEYPERFDYELEAILSNTQYKLTYESSIESIKKLNAVDIQDNSQNRLLKNNLFVSIITAMETYFSDAFINIIDKRNNYLREFVSNHKNFQQKKIKKSEIFDEFDSIKKQSIQELKDLTFHNLDQVKYLYEKTLKVGFPSDLGDYFKMIEKRHDIVHRNGKTKCGIIITISAGEIDDSIEQINDLVKYIDIQIADL